MFPISTSNLNHQILCDFKITIDNFTKQNVASVTDPSDTNNVAYPVYYDGTNVVSMSKTDFQDTFIKVIKTLKNGSYNEEGKFLPWVMRIAHNLVIDYFRKSNRIPIIENKEEFDIFQFLSDTTPNAESVLVEEQVLKDIQNLIEELPEDQKEVLIMRLYRDMSFKEIAENTNVSINTALGRMRYAIINLRKMINDYQIILES